MTLTFCWEVSAADWIVHSDLPWTRLVCLGPAGFDAYARLRYLPDPIGPGQSEHEADRDARPGQLPALFEALATQTTTPDDCYFCIWEGFGRTGMAGHHEAVGTDDERSPLERGAARPASVRQPAEPRSAPQVPQVVVPNRAYWLFRGALTDVGTWDCARGWPGLCRLDEADPAFVWPGDRAWCIASDVDPHYAGIGASTAIIDRLLAHPGLDVVLADPGTEQPHFS